jgi:hypothetical protein
VKPYRVTENNKQQQQTAASRQKEEQEAMFENWRTESQSFCPELPIRPTINGNEVAVVASG